MYYFYNFRNNWLLDNIASNVLAMGFILIFSMVDCNKFKILRFVGTHSFILYLLQGKIIYRFPYALLDAGLKRVISFIIVLGMSIFLSAMINGGIEHIGNIQRNG